jgi:heat shock transcription factor, other eukaryote
VATETEGTCSALLQKPINFVNDSFMELKANRKTSPGKSLFRALIVKLLIEQGFRKVDPDRWEFAHASFLRGQTHLLRNIVRRGSSAGGKRAKDAAAPAADGDDMAMVATEVVRLKQEQRAIDDHVASMWRRVQETERRPKQMLAFLLKVVGDRDGLHRLVGDAATPDAPGSEAAAEVVGGEKRARLLLDGDFGAFGPDAADFAGFYSGDAGALGDVAVDAASGSGGGCSFAFGVDTGY